MKERTPCPVPYRKRWCEFPPAPPVESSPRDTARPVPVRRVPPVAVAFAAIFGLLASADVDIAPPPPRRKP